MPWVAFRILFFGIVEPADRLDSFLNSATFSKTQAFPQPSTKVSHLGESVGGAVDKDRGGRCEQQTHRPFAAGT